MANYGNVVKLEITTIEEFIFLEKREMINLPSFNTLCTEAVSTG